MYQVLQEGAEFLFAYLKTQIGGGQLCIQVTKGPLYPSDKEGKKIARKFYSTSAIGIK